MIANVFLILSGAAVGDFPVIVKTLMISPANID